MIPYYIQKHTETTGDGKSNRKSALCPICRREELISNDSELVKCSICCQIGASQKSEPSLKGEDIKALRGKMGVSINSLSDDLKISKRYLEMMEQGKRQVTNEIMDWYKSHSINTQTDSDAQNSLF